MPASRRVLLALAAASLLAGVVGGLQRMGALPFGTLGGAAALSHGTLMVSGFLGTVIALERAIAYGGRVALFAPAASALGAGCLLAGFAQPAAVLLLAAPLVLCAVSAGIVRRQRAVHNVALLVGALAWLAGNVALVAGASPDAVAAWWFAFIVLTVAAERLELGRLRPRHALAPALFLACSALLLAGAALAGVERGGTILFAAALLAMAAWLFAFDLAWRTVRTHGYARYAAYALLAGYAWLVVAALAWVAKDATLLGAGARDAALHAIALGFAFSMIFAHAPIIVPVVARVRVRYTPLFYVPLALLHLSLAWRIFAGLTDIAVRRQGAWLDAAALLLFAASLVHATRTPAP
jgi:hypothetical protein